MMYKEKKNEYNRPLTLYVQTTFIFALLFITYIYFFIVELFNSLFNIGDNCLGILRWDECIVIFPIKINGKNFQVTAFHLAVGFSGTN